MKTLKFKTSAMCSGCVANIGKSLNEIAKPEQWSIDLSSKEKVLTIETDKEPEEIIRLIEKAGYKASQL
ncbi:heavy-metal-associated domain-containing protein [Bacteroides sedimenti]|uniref:HMA domain-containing protein n=1 Tax=Bacteroides sedimenti TaxID=2136147 RepID=A0ABN6Z9Q9_9BACE